MYKRQTYDFYVAQGKKDSEEALDALAELQDEPVSYTHLDVYKRQAQVAPGVTIGQQKRKAFGFSWVTTKGNDITDEAGQKIHVAWNSTASPSEKSYSSTNDNPDAIIFSWECSASPVNVKGHRPTCHMEIDCSKLKEKTVLAIQNKLWGSDGGSGVEAASEATLPSPDELIKLITDTEAAA